MPTNVSAVHERGAKAEAGAERIERAGRGFAWPIRRSCWSAMPMRCSRAALGEPTSPRRGALCPVAAGLAVTLLPDLVLPAGRPGSRCDRIAGDPVGRTIFAVTRAADAKRPSTKALVAAVGNAAASLPVSLDESS